MRFVCQVDTKQTRERINEESGRVNLGRQEGRIKASKHVLGSSSR